MGLFNKRKEEPSEFDIFNTIDKSDWIQVFSACLGKMLVIQNNAAKYVVKGRGWNVDFEQGIVCFGEDKYPIQFIGNESNSSNTWMWGWNNINNFSENLIDLPNKLLLKGEEWNLDPLTIAKFDLNDILNGHNLSIVVCGLSKDNYFYYRGPHNSGAVFLQLEMHQKRCFYLRISMNLSI